MIFDEVGREIVAEGSCMFHFKFVIRFNFFAYTISLNTFKFELSFTILDFGKPNLSVVHQSDCVVFMLVLKPTISTYFSAVDLDMCGHISAMRFVIRDANSANNCGSDDAGIATALGISLSDIVDEHHDTEDGKCRLRAEQEKSRLHARISFLLVS